jgi:redox-sensitive bicupin YhaK (pirin superfamily)
MSAIRQPKKILASQPTIEGAGVRLKRAFGFRQVPEFDPFLLLDHFGSSDPADYLPGFPWHPHRGIETITYMLVGEVEHGDSLGNKGVIGTGDVQWMTAGSGIIHQEMPKGGPGGVMGGMQLWANLPASQKMMDPRYRDVQSRQIPEVTAAGGARIKVICGDVQGVKGPVGDIVIDPEYLDVSLPAGATFTHPVKAGHTVFAYVFEGEAFLGGRKPDADAGTGPGHVVLFGDGDQIVAAAGGQPARFVLVAGKPLHEPIAWAGPIVMNTQDELRLAFDEYNQGTFIKHGAAR